MTSLRSLGVKSAAGPLVKVLSDPEASVRAAAASALGATGDPLAIDGLVRLLNDANTDVRVAAAEALVTLPLPSAAASTPPAALLSALTDKNARVRAAAATLLGKWRCPGAVPSLVRTLENPGERVEVRVAACAALARFRLPKKDSAMHWRRGCRLCGKRQLCSSAGAGTVVATMCSWPSCEIPRRTPRGAWKQWACCPIERATRRTSFEVGRSRSNGRGARSRFASIVEAADNYFRARTRLRIPSASAFVRRFLDYRMTHSF